MSVKIVFVFCAQALFIQSTLSQCTNRAAVSANHRIISPIGLAGSYGLGAPYGLATPYGLDVPYGLGTTCGLAASVIDITPTSGGALPVSSASAIAPVGLAVESENIYEGILAAAGEVPFVGTVGVEGVLPTAGIGAVHHACGNSINAMVSDKTTLTPGYIGSTYAPAAAIAPIAPELAAPALGFRGQWTGTTRGCSL